VTTALDVTGAVAFGTGAELGAHADPLPCRTNLRDARDTSRAAASLAPMSAGLLLVFGHASEVSGPRKRRLRLPLRRSAACRFRVKAAAWPLGTAASRWR
jgi:hypothetical protein